MTIRLHAIEAKGGEAVKRHIEQMGQAHVRAATVYLILVATLIWGILIMILVELYL